MTATVLNDVSLFVGKIVKTSDYGIIMVRGTIYEPSHIGMAKLSITDDNGVICKILIPKELYFPLSPVNMLSIGKLSLAYEDSDSTGNDGTYIKSMFNRSFFS